MNIVHGIHVYSHSGAFCNLDSLSSKNIYIFFSYSKRTIPAYPTFLPCTLSLSFSVSSSFIHFFTSSLARSLARSSSFIPSYLSLIACSDLLLVVYRIFYCSRSSDFLRFTYICMYKHQCFAATCIACIYHVYIVNDFSEIDEAK